MKTYWGSEGIASRILDFGITSRWVVSFTPRPLYPQGKSPWYPLDRRLGGPQSLSGRGGEEKKSSPRRESNSRTPFTAIFRFAVSFCSIAYGNKSSVLTLTLPHQLPAYLSLTVVTCFTRVVMETRDKKKHISVLYRALSCVTVLYRNPTTLTRTGVRESKGNWLLERVETLRKWERDDRKRNKDKT
jgi:hypothetical protein